MANFININKTARIEAQGTHTNGNTKSVVRIDPPAFFTSVTDAAKDAEVHVSVMSNHVRGMYKTCKGKVYMFADDPRVISVMAQQLSKKDKEIAYMEHKQSELDELKAKADAYDKLMAEQEAARKAEERRLERERKAEEKRQKKMKRLNDKIEHYGEQISKIDKKRENLYSEMIKAIDELESLKNNGKEVV